MWSSKPATTASKPATVSLSAPQKKAVEQLRELVDLSGYDDKLIDILTKHKWNLDQAIDYYFNHQDEFTALKGKQQTTSSGSSKFDPKTCLAFFNNYSKGADKMDSDQIEAFFNDLGVNAAEDVVTILFAQYCEAQFLGELSQSEFIKGCSILSCDNIKTLKDVIQKRLYQELKDEAQFAKLYKYTFEFAKEKGFKNVEIELACSLWELLLTTKCKFLKTWIKFWQEEKKDLKVVPKDTWDLFYDLVKQTQGDLKNFVDDGAWPSQIDEFMLFASK